jgi:hypothetical protein
VTGADTVFKTAPATGSTASDITVVGATLNGVVDADGQATTWRFEYGTTSAYGTNTSDRSAGSTGGEQTVSQSIGNLEPATTYHYRLVAIRSGQTVTSDDGTFTTVAAPDVTINAPTDVTATSATFHGATDTHGAAGTFTFTVTATDSGYATTTPSEVVPDSGTLTATLSDLPGDGSFTVQVNVTAGGAARHSAKAAFSTPVSVPYTGPTRAGDGLDPYPTDASPVRSVNNFQIKASRVMGSGRKATLTLTLPGPGVVRITHRYLKTVDKTVEGGTVTLRLSLNKAGLRALRKARSRARSVAYHIRYTSTGGSTARQRDRLTFKRKASR